MSTNFPIPETKVLAIASHVVYGYVGNTMATFVMQSLGCDVAAINTVHFSNHTGYRQFQGRRHPASELTDLYTGLKASNLTDFTMLLTGYAPSAAAITAIRHIAMDLQSRAAAKPGSFFWILDPVMGDQGRLYVAEDVVPMYKELITHADLILPNQFEAEMLSGVKIVDLKSLKEAVEVLHRVYNVPHVVVTSLTFPSSAAAVSSDGETETIAVAGSSRTTDGAARLFIVHVPKLNCFFSGTGDMFAALMVVRMREAAIQARLDTVRAWMSGDDVQATNLPLARAVEVVLAGMGGVLEETMQARDREMRVWEEANGVSGGEGDGDEEEHAKRKYLAETKAAEVRVVRNVDLLRCSVVRRRAERVVV